MNMQPPPPLLEFRNMDDFDIRTHLLHSRNVNFSLTNKFIMAICREKFYPQRPFSFSITITFAYASEAHIVFVTRTTRFLKPVPRAKRPLGLHSTSAVFFHVRVPTAYNFMHHLNDLKISVRTRM